MTTKLRNPNVSEARQKIAQIIVCVNKNNRPENFQIGQHVLDIHPGDTITKTLSKWKHASYAICLAEEGESPKKVIFIILARVNELQACV
jgi:hypothetical protein